MKLGARGVKTALRASSDGACHGAASVGGVGTAVGRRRAFGPLKRRRCSCGGMRGMAAAGDRRQLARKGRRA